MPEALVICAGIKPLMQLEVALVYGGVHKIEREKESDKASRKGDQEMSVVTTGLYAALLSAMFAF